MRCGICELSCEIGLETHGRCGMYRLDERGIVPRHISQISTLNVGRIEDVPIFHYHPGSLTLSIGTIGCNFDCGYCHNPYAAHASIDSVILQPMTPADVVDRAEEAGCQNIAFTRNEPAVSFPFFLATARQARARGLRVGCTTNGYFSEKAMDVLSNVIDFVNVSLKATTDPFYRRVCKVPSVRPVLRNIQLFRERGVHVEISTPITMDTWEDDLLDIANFVSNVGRDLPWHIFELPANYHQDDQDWADLAYLTDLRKKALLNLDHVFIRATLGSDRNKTNGTRC